jgi:multiple sugar transport system permease protein
MMNEMTTPPAAPSQIRPHEGPFDRAFQLRWDNWPAVLVLFVIGLAASVATLPPAVSFWVSAALAALLAISLIANAWGRYTGGLLVTPALMLLFLMNVFPLLWSLGLSFFDYRANRAKAPTWVGLENYQNVLTDPDVWDRLHNTVTMVILTVTTQMIVGFLLALLFSKQFPLRRYLMILVLTPMMLSFVAVGAFFRYYYDPTFGLLSQAVRFFTGHPYTLMGSVWGSRAGIVFADAWMWSPFVMLLVLAGLVSVPKYLYEAAAIDRVPWWRQFVFITFPYIKSLLLLALLFRTIEAFKLFDLVFLLTNGGPGTATETIALKVYRIAFENNRTSESTALAYILLFTVIVLTNLYLYFASQRAKEA